MLQSQGEPGGAGGEALCYFASTGYPEQGTGFQGHRLMFVTAVLFLLKLQEHRDVFFRPDAF